jgi:hypothetical protein
MSRVPLDAPADDAAAGWAEPVAGAAAPEFELEELHPAVTAIPSDSSAIAESLSLVDCIPVLL